MLSPVLRTYAYIHPDNDQGGTVSGAKKNNK